MAALNLNKVILCGRFTADPELKQTPGNVYVTSFTIAINRRQQKDEKPKADFISVVAWRKTAEFITKFFKKGDSICLIGNIQSRSYTTQSGEKRYATEVIAEEARFIDSKSDNSGENSAGYMPDAYTGEFALEEVALDDDVPF